MLPKFSVKKPFTVFVALIMVLVLGVVSFSKMSTDLLPNMNMPYVIALTTYPGASPEKVETSVTNPLEKMFATVSGVENITSISQENTSVVMLEFTQSTNMDSAIIDLNSKVDLVEGNFDDAVGSTTILKLNPNMMPIMMLSADVEGMSSDEVSTYVNEEIVPNLERAEGVASVTAVGLVEDQLQITLDKDKIKDLNEKIKGNINSTMDEKESDLDDAISKLEESQSELEDKGKEQTSKLNSASIELDSALTQLETTLSQLNSFSMISGQLQPSISDAKELLKKLKEDLTKLEEELKKAQDSNIDTSKLKEQIDSLKSKISSIEKSIDKVANSTTPDTSKLSDSIEDLKLKQQQVEDGKSILNQELTKATIQIMQSKAQLQSAKEQLETARKEALKQSDMTSTITPDMINSVLTAQNFSMPAGYISNDTSKYSVKVGDKFTSIDEVKNVLIFSSDEIGKVHLKDIADIKLSNNASDSYTNINGNPGIMLSVEKTSTASTSTVSKAVNNNIDNLTKNNKKLRILTFMDQGVYIDMVIDSIMSNLIYGGILAILILLLFLRSIKPTIIIAFSIPVSLLFAVVLMYFSGISFNMISLSGLSLGVGMLVDNSIVVIENIYRLRNNGVGKIKAAVYGAKQVSGAILASTVTTICVFLPIVFTDGITKQLFVDMGATIAFSLIASLIIALTLVPCMASNILNTADDKKHKIFDSLVNLYERLLEKALNHSAIVILGSVLLLVLAGFCATRMGTAFMPPVNSTQMSATLKLKDKDGTDEDLEKSSSDFIEKVSKIDGIKGVGAIKSQEGVMFSVASTGYNKSISTYIVLDDDIKRTNKEVAEEIKNKTKSDIYDVSVQQSNLDISAAVGSGISIQVEGDDLDKLRDISLHLKNLLKSVDGVGEITSDTDSSDIEQRISVDKDKATKYGLTVAQVYSEISKNLKENISTSSITHDDKDLPIVVQNKTYDSVESLGDMKISGKKDNKDVKVKLDKIATIDNAKTSKAITHDNQKRIATVSVSIDSKHNIGLVSRDVQAKLDKYKSPEGYNISVKGETETIEKTMTDLILMILLAIIFIYLIMVAQFQSLLSPFIIMFTIPLAFTGGLLALAITNQVLSVTSMLGFLVLAGIVVNNGIVFVDYVNQLRLSGYEKRAALLQTGRDRIRPILMTAMTTILAMSTMALGVGMGSELSQGLSIVTIGGLLYSTLLTLFIVPILYNLFHRKKELKKVVIDIDD